MAAIIKGFEYDIFISYAHADNRTFSWQDRGWVDQFYQDLSLQVQKLNGPPAAVWWDTQLIDGTQVFNDTISNGIKKSAILVSLTSLSYLHSTYCKQELSCFHNKASTEPYGLQLGDRFRIINVLLQDLPPTQWPDELKGRTGFPFYKKKRQGDVGDPLDIRLDNQMYQDCLLQLGHAIDKVLKAFPKEVAPISNNLPITGTTKKNFTVLFGDAVDSLDNLKRRAIAELKNKGFEVRNFVPPPLEAEGHKAAVTQMIKECDLTVHLLEAFPGKPIYDNNHISYPQQEASLGLAFGKNQLIWVPDDLDPAKIEEESYKSLITSIESGTHQAKNLEYIRGARSTLIENIVAHATSLKAIYEKAVAQERLSILLDPNPKDERYAFELSNMLSQNQVTPYIDPQSDDPIENELILKIRIAKVKKLVFFFGEVAQEWLDARIKATLKLLMENQYPRKELFVILVPPQKDPKQTFLEESYFKINVIDNSNSPHLDPNVFRRLL